MPSFQAASLETEADAPVDSLTSLFPLVPTWSHQNPIDRRKKSEFGVPNENPAYVVRNVESLIHCLYDPQAHSYAIPCQRRVRNARPSTPGTAWRRPTLTLFGPKSYIDGFSVRTG